MTRRLTRASADELLLSGANDELHDAHALAVLLLEVHHATAETDIDPDGVGSPYSRTQRTLLMIEGKLRAALLALGQVL